MKLTSEELNKIMRSEEYMPYISSNLEGETFINFKAMPKSNYLPVNGDYVFGLIFSQRLNDDKLDIVKLEVNNGELGE